jgi:hypothetical protein
MKRLIQLAAVLSLVVPALSTFSDCQDSDSLPGPFGVKTFDAMWDSRPLVVQTPTSVDVQPPSAGFPLVVFMHGSTGEYEMYRPNLEHYTSHVMYYIIMFSILSFFDMNACIYIYIYICTV